MARGQVTLTFGIGGKRQVATDGTFVSSQVVLFHVAHPLMPVRKLSVGIRTILGEANVWSEISIDVPPVAFQSLIHSKEPEIAAVNSLP